MVVERGASGYEVTGVFDLDGGFAGDAEEDLARSLWQFARRGRAAEALLSAYRAERPPSPGSSERLRAYVVCDLLVIWEYGRRERMPWFGDHDSFHSYARSLLRPVEKVL